jgi:exportin-7
VCALCATAIDHLFTYIFLNQRRDKPTIQMIRQHITAEPDLPDQLMATLFNTLLFAAQANHWAITRPILSLMLSFESSFGSYRDSLLQNQPAENQQKLMEEFEKLTADIQTSVETSNRDRFTQKLTLFRLSVRQFLAF